MVHAADRPSRRVSPSRVSRSRTRSSGQDHVSARGAEPSAASTPSGQRPKLDAATNPLHIGVIYRNATFAEIVRTKLHAAEDLQWCDPWEGQPDVVLYTVGATSTLAALLDSGPSEPHHPAVLVDMERQIGPNLAALQGFLGYLTLQFPPERYLSCLRKAAQGNPDAPAPYDAVFLAARERGPLTELDRTILRMVGTNQMWEQIAETIQMNQRELQEYGAELLERMGLGMHHDLQMAAAVSGYLEME